MGFFFPVINLADTQTESDFAFGCNLLQLRIHMLRKEHYSLQFKHAEINVITSLALSIAVDH